MLYSGRRSPGTEVGGFVAFVSSVASNPFEGDVAAGELPIDRNDQVSIGDGFSRRGLPPAATPVVNPAGQGIDGVFGIRFDV